MKERFNYGTPLWAVTLLCSISLILSSLALLAFINFEHWSAGSSSFLKWLLLLLSFIFLVVAIKPNNWKPWIYFYADSTGLHFPSDCPETRGTQWLTVPWSRVQSIKKERFTNRFMGPVIKLDISDAEISKFFKDSQLAKQFFYHTESDTRYFTIGYSNAFINTDKAVNTLYTYKKNSSSQEPLTGR